LAATAGPAQPGIGILALATRQPVIVDDIEFSPVIKGRARAALRASRIRAVHAYPLLDGGGQVHAVLSLHYWQPSPRRDTSCLIAEAAAQALSKFVSRPAAEPR
jgi:hypothetical protein